MNFDQLYADFTQKVIPTIAQGIQITKEYATDLFGRYIQYLIIVDSIKAAVFLLVVSVSTFALVKVILLASRRTIDEEWIGPAVTLWMVITSIAFMAGAESVFDLIKDLTIPEIRIYEIYSKK